MPRIDTDTQLCAVIGNPVTHSLSPAMHNAAFETAKLNYVYVAFAVQDVAGCLAGMRALPSFRGMSVTIPHKVAVMDYLDEVDDLARHVGCVNTITNDGGRLLGTITDGLGTLRAFAEAEVDLTGKRVLFLGAGGAVRAVAFAMAENAHTAGVTLLGRTAERVAALGRDLRDNTDAHIAWGSLADGLEEAMASHDVVINGTPLGMYPENIGLSPVPGHLFREEHVAFDMVYRPSLTAFLSDAQAAGCITIPGLDMLVNQAELQFECWTGQAAPAGVMRSALMEALAEVR